jgi:DNA-binding MarR family transcriptional regulator
MFGPDGRIVQPVCRIPLEVMRDSGLSALSRLAYGVLVSFCAPNTNECSASLVEIADRMGVTPQNVSRLIQNLEAPGVITVERENVRGKANRYILNRGA